MIYFLLNCEILYLLFLELPWFSFSFFNNVHCSVDDSQYLHGIVFSQINNPVFMKENFSQIIFTEFRNHSPELRE